MDLPTVSTTYNHILFWVSNILLSQSWKILGVVGPNTSVNWHPPSICILITISMVGHYNLLKTQHFRPKYLIHCVIVTWISTFTQKWGCNMNLSSDYYQIIIHTITLFHWINNLTWLNFHFNLLQVICKLMIQCYTYLKIDIIIATHFLRSFL